MLAALDGSCRTPIAGLAEFEDGRLTIEGLLLRPDGSSEIRGQNEGIVGDAEALGTELGKDIAGPCRSRFRFRLVLDRGPIFHSAAWASGRAAARICIS